VNGAIELRWAGEDWLALAARALWWPRRRTLCVADLHLGKAAAFRDAGVPVPESTTDATLARLSAIIERFAAARLVILGDLLHARTGHSPAVIDAVDTWRERHDTLDIFLVRGNHDARSGDPPESWRIRVCDEPCCDEGDAAVCFAHYPEAADRVGRGRHVLCGHVHPAVLLSSPGRDLRAACFWLRRRVGILPAFGPFTGTHVVLPSRGDRVLAVGGGEIVDVTPKDSKLKAASPK
jgi:DNA ligase-associated metallophosphoesterase